MTTYEKIETVLKSAGMPLAPHEFAQVGGNIGEDENDYEPINGREYIGCSEAALGRRLREMRQMGMVTAKRREGKAFVEYALVVSDPAVMPKEPVAA